MPSSIQKLAENVGIRRIICVLLALFGPMVTYALHPTYGEAIFWGLLLLASMIFSKVVVVIFFIDLVVVQLLASKEGIWGFKPNKVVRDFEIISVIVIVAVYGAIYGTLVWYGITHRDH